MDLQTQSASRLDVQSSAHEERALATLIEDLHTLILGRADPGLVLEALDALARTAEGQLRAEQAASRSGRKLVPRARQREHEAFLAQLNVFRQEFARAPSEFDQAQLYDFLSEWLIHALYEE